jgi:hypothetical protein
MRTTLAALLLFITPAVAAAQDSIVSVVASAGPTLYDRGRSISAGIAFNVVPELSMVATVQRDHLDARVTAQSTFRGGTLTTVSTEARYEPLARARVSPFGVLGMGIGISQPNVLDPRFDRAVTNRVRSVFAGAGVRIPIDESLSIVADVRWVLFGGDNDYGGVAPLRAGIAWRF